MVGLTGLGFGADVLGATAGGAATTTAAGGSHARIRAMTTCAVLSAEIAESPVEYPQATRHSTKALLPAVVSTHSGLSFSRFIRRPPDRENTVNERQRVFCVAQSYSFRART